MLQEWARVYFKTISELALVMFFLFYPQDTQIEIMVSKKTSLRVLHYLSIYLRYLHQDQDLSVRSLCRRYPQFSLPTIWRHGTKKIEFHPSKQNGRVDVNSN